MKSKAFYDEDGNIESLFVYRTEDILHYTKQEIDSDIKLLEHLELSSQISFVIETNNLVNRNGVKDILERIDDDLFISEKDGKVVLHKIGNY